MNLGKRPLTPGKLGWIKIGTYDWWVYCCPVISHHKHSVTDTDGGKGHIGKIAGKTPVLVVAVTENYVFFVSANISGWIQQHLIMDYLIP